MPDILAPDRDAVAEAVLRRWAFLSDDNSHSTMSLSDAHDLVGVVTRALAEAGAPSEPTGDTAFGGVRIDVTVATGESLWLRTPEAVVQVSALVGTQVAVYDSTDDNPVGIVQLRRALAGGPSQPTEEPDHA